MVSDRVEPQGGAAGSRESGGAGNSRWSRIDGGGRVAGLEKLAGRHLIADFIFLDPPYAKTPEHLSVLEYLDASHLIAPRGLVIVEHHWRVELPERLDRLECTREIEQGECGAEFLPAGSRRLARRIIVVRV